VVVFIAIIGIDSACVVISVVAVEIILIVVVVIVVVVVLGHLTVSGKVSDITTVFTHNLRYVNVGTVLFSFLLWHVRFGFSERTIQNRQFPQLAPFQVVLSYW